MSVMSKVKKSVSKMDMLGESGIEDGFVQELSASGEEQIPAFDGTGVERP